MRNIGPSIQLPITELGAKSTCRTGWGMAGRFDYPQALEIRDADLFLEKTEQNAVAVVEALAGLGFNLTEKQADEIRLEEAWRNRVEVEGLHVCHLDDIIASKEASNRARDREALPRLRAFRDYWLRQQGMR